MAGYPIEVPQGSEPTARLWAVEALVIPGWYPLARGEWGCCDGEHEARLIAELGRSKKARPDLPHGSGSQTRMTKLSRSTLEEIDEFLLHQTGSGADGGDSTWGGASRAAPAGAIAARRESKS